MTITDVTIKLIDHRDTNGRVRGYATITLDDTIRIRDIRIVRTDTGRLIVSMPSRKITDRCETCGEKNHMLANYCNECGSRLRRDRAAIDEEGRPILYADVAHPLHARGRAEVERAVLEAYVAAVEHQDAGRVVAA